VDFYVLKQLQSPLF